MNPESLTPNAPLAPFAPFALPLAESLYRQGDAAHDDKNLDLAERLLRAALAADATHWLARYTLAVVLQDAGRHGEAAELYADAVAANPGHVKAWNNYGVALQYSGRREQAIDAYRRALTVAFHPGALANLSGLLAEMGRIDEARAVLDPYCDAAAPNLFDLRRALMLPVVPRSAGEVVEARAAMLQDLRRIAENPPRLVDPLREVGRTPFYLSYQPESNREMLETLARLYRRACPELSFVAPGCETGGAAWPRRARPRIGFASFFFYDHSVGRVVRGLIENLPRERFEVVVVFLGGAADDSFARALARCADRVVETPYDLAAARQTIADAELDVLCLPDFGMDPLSYFLGFARLAPVQCATWGHAETSGLDSIDWFVSTEHFERVGAEADYSERLYRLPAVASPTYYPYPLPPFSGVSHIAAHDGPVFFCGQTVYKLHPDFDPLLAGILHALPTARLYLVRSAEADWNRALQERLAATLGALNERLVWLDYLPRADYQATLAAADVVLDPPHFTGGITSLEAFALNRPIVTLEGRAMRSRFTAGFYRAMDLAALVATTPAAYVERAVAWGGDAAARAEVSRLIERRKGVLYEDRRVIDGWVTFLDAVTGGGPAAGQSGHLPR